MRREKNKSFILVLLVGISTQGYISLAHAGGAAVAKRRGGGQQVAQQRAMMQQRAVQQAMMQRQVAMQQMAQQAAVEQVATQEVALKQAAAARLQNGQAQIQGQGEIPFGSIQTDVTADVLVSRSTPPVEVKDIVSIEDLWKTFETSSENWPLIIDAQAKVLTMDLYIQIYKTKGISISKPPEYYAQMIDGMSQENPTMLSQPMDKVLQIMAIMEYDFDNGADKDQMAQKILGEQGWRANRQRLGLDGQR